MTLKEKRAFVRSLTNSVRNAILARTDAMPAEWDGHELRQFLADEFAREVYRPTMTGRRLRAYRNARATIGRL
jgi:hypothetical protein